MAAEEPEEASRGTSDGLWPPFVLMLICIFILTAAAGMAAVDKPSALTAAFPQADRFGPAEGAPPVYPAYRQSALVGYAFFSREVDGRAGYAGRPLDVAVGVTLEARIAGAKIVEHYEPILMIGIRDEQLQAFVGRYAGVDLRAGVRIKSLARAGDQAVDAIAGATVSSTALHDAIVGSARRVARARGLLGAPGAGPRLDLDLFEAKTWADLLQGGEIAMLDLDVGAADRTLSQRGRKARALPEGVAAPQTRLVAIYAAVATPALIGRNLLGERVHASLVADLPPEGQLLIVGAEGLYSIRGSNWRRSGVFDRLQIVQGERTIPLKVDQLRAVEKYADPALGALREVLVLALAGEARLDGARPWRLDVLIHGQTEQQDPASAVVALDYRPPARLLIAGGESGAATAEADAERPIWIDIWQSRAVDIGLLVVLLLGLYVILIFQDWIARDRVVWNRLRIVFALAVVGWLGFVARAQLSVVNVLTFASSLIGQHFDWAFFLLEPLIFVLWSWVAVAMLFWGRGVFCGWLCPFGALQDFVARIARALKIRQLQIPFGLHERLWPTKYILFLGLFAASLGSMAIALRGAEVEPFKTAVTMRFARDALYVAYALGLLAAGLFVERFFCRYLCPLGAALAIPARLRMFEWLKRRRQCGTECQICAVHCPVQAIHPLGQINPNECIHCLHCQTNYYDDKLCPPLIQRRTRREARAQLVKSAAGGSP
jgi:transcriptional regulator of nitric oxide reductase